MVDDDIEDDHTSRVDSVCGSSPIDATDSGVDVDRASTPDHSVESITIGSKSDEDCQDLSYNEIFENLRREMVFQHKHINYLTIFSNCFVSVTIRSLLSCTVRRNSFERLVVPARIVLPFAVSQSSPVEWYQLTQLSRVRT